MFISSPHGSHTTMPNHPIALRAQVGFGKLSIPESKGWAGYAWHEGKKTYERKQFASIGSAPSQAIASILIASQVNEDILWKLDRLNLDKLKFDWTTTSHLNRWKDKEPVPAYFALPDNLLIEVLDRPETFSKAHGKTPPQRLIGIYDTRQNALFEKGAILITQSFDSPVLVEVATNTQVFSPFTAKGKNHQQAKRVLDAFLEKLEKELPLPMWAPDLPH